MTQTLEKPLQEVILSHLTPDKFNDYYDFELKANEGKKSLREVRERFESLVLSNPLIKDKSNPHVLIACTKNNKIIGKLVCRPVKFYFKGIKKTGFYHCDLFVDENYRKRGIGTFILERALQEFKPAFINPSSKQSLSIALSLKFEFIGNLRKFVWLRNIKSFAQATGYSIFKNKWPFKAVSKERPFPPVLNFGKYHFNLVRSLDKWYDYPFSTDTLEFTREIEHLNWHMSIKSGYYDYYFAENHNLPFYFAVKKTFWRGLNILEIADYKVHNNDEDTFRSIITAAKYLTKKLNFDGVIVMTTHSFFDEILKRNFFAMIGKPMHLLASLNTCFSKDDIKNRKVLYATIDDI